MTGLIGSEWLLLAGTPRSRQAASWRSDVTDRFMATQSNQRGSALDPSATCMSLMGRPRCSRSRSTNDLPSPGLGTSQAFKCVNRALGNNFLMSPSKLTRCSVCWSTAAASQPSGSSLPASCLSRHSCRSFGHSGPSDAN